MELPYRAFACFVSPGGGAFANFVLLGSRAFAKPRGHSRAFDTHAVSYNYQNVTTKKVLMEKTQIGSSVKDRGFSKGRTIRKVMGGEGNFRAAGIFFRYQIPCMNFF